MGTNYDARVVDDPRSVVVVEQGLPNQVTVILGQGLSTGANILSGSGDPVSATGMEGDFYIDTDAGALWGPKGASAWDPAPLGAVVPVASASYTVTNVTTVRSLDADSTSLDELADVLGTLIADLQTANLIN